MNDERSAPEPPYRVAGEVAAEVALVPLATMVEELRGLADQLADLARRNEGLALEVGTLRERQTGQETVLAAKDQTIAELRRRAEVAEAVGVSVEALRQWTRRGIADGLDALAARRPGSGAAPKLAAAQQEQVVARAEAGPRATMPQLRRRIREARQIELSETQAWALVRGRGRRRVVPRRRHYQADPAALEAAEKNCARWRATRRRARASACCSRTRPGGGCPPMRGGCGRAGHARWWR